MQDTGDKTSSEELQSLWEEVGKNNAEIRRRVLAILEHPETPKELKKHSALAEVVR